MGFESAYYLIFSGAAGAFVRETFSDNCLELPKKVNGKIFLGFIGSLILGAAAGYFIDNSPATAFLAGFTAMELFQTIIPKIKKIK